MISSVELNAIYRRLGMDREVESGQVIPYFMWWDMIDVLMSRIEALEKKIENPD